MQHKNNTDDLGKHCDDVIGLACKGHAEEDTEDIKRQKWDDGHLDGLLDDSAELREAFLQNR